MRLQLKCWLQHEFASRNADENLRLNKSEWKVFQVRDDLRLQVKKIYDFFCALLCFRINEHAEGWTMMNIFVTVIFKVSRRGWKPFLRFFSVRQAGIFYWFPRNSPSPPPQTMRKWRHDGKSSVCWCGRITFCSGVIRSRQSSRSRSPCCSAHFWCSSGAWWHPKSTPTHCISPHWGWPTSLILCKRPTLVDINRTRRNYPTCCLFSGMSKHDSLWWKFFHCEWLACTRKGQPTIYWFSDPFLVP